jgi:hypothetical protein
VGAVGLKKKWINHPFLEAGKTGTAFDNYGGEDRFWLGPEGGQFGLYFAPGAPFKFDAWQTPKDLNEGEWTLASRTERSVVLTRTLHVQNHQGASFDVAVERTITLLTAGEMAGRLAAPLSAHVRAVGFETKNRVSNVGPEAWTKEKGLVSVWILGMYSPSSDANVLVPFETSASGPIVNDRYFGKVPTERLTVQRDFLSFVCDGIYRSKIGLGPGRAKNMLGSYSASAHLLTLVLYDKPPAARDYVNSMWEQQSDPYGGDVVNSYNDGPTEPGKPSLGGFYEIETSSPAAALAPGQSLTHTHRTIHLVAGRDALAPIAQSVRGVTLPGE